MQEAQHAGGCGGREDAHVEKGGGPASTVDIRLLGPLRVITPSMHLSGRIFRAARHASSCHARRHIGKPVSKDRLIELLWGDRLPMNPGATVEHTVSGASVLRQEGVPSAIVTAAGGYRFDLSRARIDVVEFDGLVEAAARQSGVDALRRLEAAVGFVDGKFLEDEKSAPWVAVIREHYHRRVERALLDGARLALAHDQPELARSLAERAAAAQRCRTRKPV